MKISIVLLLVNLVIWANTGCKKDSIAPGVPIVPIPENTAPHASAGEDIFVWSPSYLITLRGSYSDNENNVKKVNWAKISGPNSYRIENEDSLSTKIDGLEEGAYLFELTITDNMNLRDRDMVAVYVGKLSANANEIIFNDLAWNSISPWYPSVEIKNFVGNVAPGSAFKIFVQRDYDSTWNEVPLTNQVSPPANALYDYIIGLDPDDLYEDNSLYVFNYVPDVSDTPNVKIVY